MEKYRVMKSELVKLINQKEEINIQGIIKIVVAF